MQAELFWLTLSVGLLIVQMLVAATGTYLRVGLVAMAGNREGLPEMTGWAGRAARAHRNMLENLLPFAALVLVLVALRRSSEVTVLAAQLFFWGRVAYALIYLAGVKWLRTLAWVVSLAGILLILAVLLGWKAGPAY